MRKIIILLLLGVVFATSCNIDIKNGDQSIKISGHLHNFKKDNVTLIFGEMIETAPVNKNGNFDLKVYVYKDPITAYKSGYYTLKIPGGMSQILYLETGDSIHLEYDIKERTKIKYSGDRVNYNDYLLQKKLNSLKANGFNSNFRFNFMLDEQKFLAKLDSFEIEDKKFLDNFVKIKPIAPQLVLLEKENIYYSYLGHKFKYEEYKGILDKKPHFKVSTGYYSHFTKNLDINKEELVTLLKSYKNVVIDYIKLHSKKDDVIDILNSIDTKVKNYFVKNYLYADVTKDYLKRKTTKNIEKLYEVFKQKCKNYQLTNEVDKVYNKVGKLKKGNSAIDFTYEDINKNKVSLSDFKGKFIYVDVWATWCGPCKTQIPHLKKLEKDYHDKNIVFMSVSIDDYVDREKWLKMIKDKELTGVQLIADKGWDSFIMKAYNIRGIPRFMLFDDNGNIISINAPRPSDKKIRKLFYNLKL